ncbi:MAG: MBL fold metallo-hydrolase [Tenericutes bacterium]|nr:MBL fold metallo-hydrolase [Mycoplasmatota bacterium]
MTKHKKIKKNIKRNFFEILIILLAFLIINNQDKIKNLFNQNNNQNQNDYINTNNNLLKVHYLDVGQGDSIFIELPNNETMLIDAAESYQSENIINYLKNLNYQKIDYVIGTHPHTDHIGGLKNIINTFEIGKIFMPKVVSTTKTYESLLMAIKDKNLKINTAKAGTSIIDTDTLKINILAPNNSIYTELNNYSVVTKITYGTTKFLFMGDAEKLSENEIKENVTTDVIKIGHHGSNTSSSIDFIKKVNAKYGIISVGLNNKYNLPKEETITNWENSGTKIYLTSTNGTIRASSDGTNIKIESEK